MTVTLPADRIGRTDAARRVGVSAPTITRWIDRGLIAGYKVGGRIFVSESDFDEMLGNSRIPVTAP
jgi:excisionase family DNA binding protein